MIAAEQARAFLVMALCGAVCGAAYDGMMLIRHALGVGAWLGGTLDLLFGAAAAVGMTMAGLFLRMDPFRLYAFAGVALGALLWFATGGALGRRTAGVLGKIVQKRTKNPGKVEG